MSDFSKIDSFNKTPVRNRTVSDLNTSAPSFTNLINQYTSNQQNPTNALPDNVANRVIPKNNILDSSQIKNYSKMYSELSKFIDDESKKHLQTLHENKKLLSNNSNEGSSTIENLYKIMTQPRAGGFDPKILLNETLKTLADPYIITQDFGKIPEAVVPQLVSEENTRVQNRLAEEKQKPENKFEKKEILKTITPIESIKQNAVDLAQKISNSVSPNTKPEDILNTNSQVFSKLKLQAANDPQKTAEFEALKEEVVNLTKKVGTPISSNTKLEDILAVNTLLLSIMQVQAANNPQEAAQIMPQIAQYQEQYQSLSQLAEEINFSKGHTCPAASMEFDLADKKPAEFARYIERLTSPDKCVKTKIKYSNIADDLPTAVSKLVDWKIDYQKLNADNIEVTLRPDENAYPRAIVQEYGRAKDSRSVVDSLLQSTFMQAGSEKTYNSLTDLRSEDTGQGRGLNQEEGAFMESIIDYEGGKDSVTYMDLDENLTKINKYNFDPKTTEAQLTETLNRGKNIMVGFLTDVDEKGNLVSANGHEILLTGIVQDKNGEKLFKYNDTDDGNNYAPSFIKVSELIRTLHHANLPKDVIKKYIPPQKDARLSLISDYWQLKKQNVSAPAQQAQV